MAVISELLPWLPLAAPTNELHVHPCTLAHFRTPAGPLQPHQGLLLGPVVGESLVAKRTSLYLADLYLHQEHIASPVASAASIHPRGLGFESQAPLFCNPFHFCYSFVFLQFSSAREDV